jgi:hypothetical protein
MHSRFPESDTMYDDAEDEYHRYTCQHGRTSDCDECDEYEQSRGGIDKCLNCGRYMYGDSLTKDQVCERGCVNPNEY